MFRKTVEKKTAKNASFCYSLTESLKNLKRDSRKIGAACHDLQEITLKAEFPLKPTQSIFNRQSQ